MSRVARFAAVGVLGWLVQLAALTILLRLGLHYAPATAAAVELTILHNFAWHERYTWRDRRAASGRAIARRLLRFNASTAVVSIVGNVFVTALAVQLLELPVLVATTLACTALSVVNYASASRWVFDLRLQGQLPSQPPP